MAKAVQSYTDNAGKRFDTAEDATISDIATLLGRLGSDPGMTDGIARKLLEKRSELEAIFAELERLKSQEACHA